MWPSHVVLHSSGDKKCFILYIKCVMHTVSPNIYNIYKPNHYIKSHAHLNMNGIQTSVILYPTLNVIYCNVLAWQQLERSFQNISLCKEFWEEVGRRIKGGRQTYWKDTALWDSGWTSRFECYSQRHVLGNVLICFTARASEKIITTLISVH